MEILKQKMSDCSPISNKIMYDICVQQGRIWEIAASKGLDMEEFSKKYLSSSFCKSFDKCWSLYQVMNPHEAFDEFISTNKVTERSDKLYYGVDVSYFAGFMYRFIAFKTHKKNADIQKHLSFSELVRRYPGLHTVSEEEALDEILESHKDLEY